MGAGASGVSAADAHPKDVFSLNGETWNEYIDSGSGEKYWNNVDTGDSTFEKPALVKLIEKERERDAILFGEDEDLDESTRNVIKKADKEATIRRMEKVEIMANNVAKEDQAKASREKMLKLAKYSGKKEILDDDQLASKRQALMSENIFAKNKLADKQMTRLRVEAENEVERFIDWLEMNRARVLYEDKFSGKLPLELQFREILVKSSNMITAEEIKKLRETRQDLIEEWAYDDTKILMVQSKWRAKKGKLHAHMIRQGKRAKKDWGIKEREMAEERRRAMMLNKVVEDEKEAEELLKKTNRDLESEHIDKVLDELRAGSTLQIVGNEVGLAFEEKARKDRLKRKDVSTIRGVHTSSLRHALRNGTYDRRPKGHFEKLRLAQMMMSESTLRRCFLKWELQTAKNLKIREAMLLALSRFFGAWKYTYHTLAIKLKKKVASCIQNYYAMYVGHAFNRWWLRTRINFTVKSRIHNGKVISFMERRDDFTIVSSNSGGAVKGGLIRRIFVNNHGPDARDNKGEKTRPQKLLSTINSIDVSEDYRNFLLKHQKDHAAKHALHYIHEENFDEVHDILNLL
jgi:hypothetical protein